MHLPSFGLKLFSSALLVAVLSGCATTSGGYTNYAQPAQCYGQVVQKRQVQSQASGGGAVIGAIAGGLFGNALGDGSGLGTVAGAAAGGYLGHQVEKNQTPNIELTVRLQNGNYTRVMQPSAQYVNTGDWISFSCQ